MKNNDKEWILTILGYTIVFLLFISILVKRNIEIYNRVNHLENLVKYNNTIIGIQKQALDSAVYFNDIKNR